jgi:hypothetical protein
LEPSTTPGGAAGRRTPHDRCPRTPHASIDTETPRLLCEEQFERYTATVAALLEAAGLTVHHSAEDPASLRVCHPRTGYTVVLDMREDRSAEWSLDAGDEIPENTPAVRLAATITGILNGAPPRG